RGRRPPNRRQFVARPLHPIPGAKTPCYRKRLRHAAADRPAWAASNRRRTLRSGPDRDARIPAPPAEKTRARGDRQKHIRRVCDPALDAAAPPPYPPADRSLAFLRMRGRRPHVGQGGEGHTAANKSPPLEFGAAPPSSPSGCGKTEKGRQAPPEKTADDRIVRPPRP